MNKFLNIFLSVLMLVNMADIAVALSVKETTEHLDSIIKEKIYNTGNEALVDYIKVLLENSIKQDTSFNNLGEKQKEIFGDLFILLILQKMKLLIFPIYLNIIFPIIKRVICSICLRGYFCFIRISAVYAVVLLTH